MKLTPIAIAAVALAGCAGPPQPCAPGLMRLVQTQLVFGRDIMGRATISEEEWRGFLDAEVTPRFAQGFSVADVSGQYRDKSGATIREPSKLLLVVTHGAADEAKLAAIRDAYKHRFSQESVLQIESPVCAGF
jgi:hypothetical protein